MNANDRTELLRLLARESYFERELTLASGRASNYYIDCKRTLYLPRGAHLAGELLLELAIAEGIGQLGGMAAGALPVTDAIVNAAFFRGYDLNGFFVRKETKAHGLQRRIEGPPLGSDDRCLVVEDVVTTGGSTLVAIEALREAGHQICGVLSVLDRLAGGAQAIERAAGAPYRALTTIDEVHPERPDR